MATSGSAMTRGERRRFERHRRVALVLYQYGPDERASATMADVSAGGVRLRLGRYLRPNTKVLLEVKAEELDAGALEFKGQVVWCRPCDLDGVFGAGVRIMADAPDVAEAMAGLVPTVRGLEP